MNAVPNRLDDIGIVRPIERMFKIFITRSSILSPLTVPPEFPNFPPRRIGVSSYGSVWMGPGSGGAIAFYAVWSGWHLIVGTTYSE